MKVDSFTHCKVRYGEGVEGFYDYLFSTHSTFGNITLWVTEYADTSLNATDVETFLNQTTAFMDTLDFVERYAWFGFFVSICNAFT